MPVPDRPLVVIRRSTEAPEAPAQPEPPAAVAPPAPPKGPSRAERKAAEQKRREEERVAEEKRKEAHRLAVEQKKEAERLRRAESEKQAELKRKEQAQENKKRERKHHRHSRRVTRRAASLDLRKGERVSLSIEGWSRFRRATLVVTNYRVALITRVPPAVRWIPLEEVESGHHHWRGAHSVIITSSVEVLTLQKAKREMLAMFVQLLEAEVTEARRPGSTSRHHADITQEWCDRATEIWDSRWGRFRLWIRKHPTLSLVTAVVCFTGGLFLLTALTSLFSPTR